MLTLIVGLVGVATTLIAWRAGYAVGRLDGQEGVSQPFPWSVVAKDSSKE